jgi:gamma-glutamylcyclotransferase (GGCT)/AIG2-like uncharacterized protein YtfP
MTKDRPLDQEAGKRFCFAYGSNMDRGAMSLRCPGAEPGEPAVLDGYRFWINRVGYASVVPDPDSKVYGVLWTVGAEEEVALDEYEEIDAGLYVKQQHVVTTNRAGRVEALVYAATDSRPGRPAKDYLEGILEAAKQHGFPRGYLRELEGWLRV